MLFWTKDHWRTYGVENPLHQFFILLWDEILNDETPDTWQIRTCNVLSVLDELVSAIDLALIHDVSRHSIPVLLAEARAMIKTDPVIPHHFPFVTTYLPNKSDSKHGDSEESKSTEDLHELRKRIAVTIGQLKDYHRYAIEDLKMMLVAGDEREKTKVHDLAMAVAVGWSLSGYSRQHLANIDDLLDDSEADFGRRFDQFTQRSNGTKKKYRCRFGLNWPASIASLGNYGIELTQGVPNGELTKVEQDFYGKSKSADFFCQVTVEALDPYSAGHKAQTQIANILAAINLSFPRHFLELKGRAALISGDNDTTLVSTRPPRFAAARDNPPRAAEQVAQFLEILRENRLSPEDSHQLAAALQYHRLALSASTVESRLVNLWIALECLVRREQSTLIAAVCSHIAPSAAIGNISKIIGNLAQYVSSYAVARKTRIPIEVFQRSSPFKLEIEDFLDAILDIDDGPKISALYKIVGEHELLRYRIYRVRKKHLDSAAHAADAMKAHWQNIDWQLRRVYRARNDITHRGRGSPSLSRLIRHLHTYFYEAFNNLVDDLRLNQTWSMRDAFMYRKLLFDHYLSLLSGKGKHAIDRAALLFPSRTLFRMDGLPAWVPPNASDEPNQAVKNEGPSVSPA